MEYKSGKGKLYEKISKLVPKFSQGIMIAGGLCYNGVGKLIRMAHKLGHETRPDIHMGICGEHGGEPSSVEFCHNVGLDYVSCSPFRVPVARLAAAQAAIKEKMEK